MAILLYILIFILALVVFALLFKVKVAVDFVLDGTSFEWNAELTLFGGTVKVNLKQPAKIAEKEEEKRIEKKAEPKKAERKAGFFEDILNTIKTVLQYFKKKLTIEEFDADVKIGLPDPMVTAILYGTYWSFVGGLYYALEQNVKLKQWNVEISPDFESEKLFIRHRSAYSLVPLQILIVAIHIFVKEKKIRELALGGVG